MRFIAAVCAVALAIGCSGAKDSVPAPTATTELDLPGAVQQAGPPPAAAVQPADVEIWGDFVLSQEPVTRQVTLPPRSDINTEGIAWLRRDATIFRDEQSASSDARVPLLTVARADLAFIAGLVNADAKGAFLGKALYGAARVREQNVRPSDLDGAATVAIQWSLLVSRPNYVTPLSQPESNLANSITYLRRTEKVDVNGHKGILQAFGTRKNPGDAMIEIWWFEGDVAWYLKTSEDAGLSADEALSLARAIRTEAR
jgi:hypothetical protein